MCRQRISTLVAIAFSCLAGCQHTPQYKGDTLLGLGGKDGKISKRQVADVQVAMGRSLEKRGEPAQAITAYQEAVKRDPRRVDAYVRLGVLHDQQGKFKESAGFYAKALKESPKNPQVLCNLGYSLYLQRRWAEAEERLRHAIALDADCKLAHNNLGLVLARTERTDEALLEFRRAGCDDAHAHSNLAFVLALDHRLQEARSHYGQALAANPALEPARKDLKALDDIVAKMPDQQGDIQFTSYQPPPR